MSLGIECDAAAVVVAAGENAVAGDAAGTAVAEVAESA